MKYTVTQYRKLVTVVEANSQEELNDIVQDLADEDFDVVDMEEVVEETV
tara:strand:+ start:469 stop:615 length:147 start_codon:yes stop_codon:yes gene_type:complete